MDDLLLSPPTRQALQKLAKNPPHALLILGPNGIGKCAVAMAWAKLICKNPEVLEADSKGTITIEAVRNLYTQTRSKRSGHQVVVVKHAHNMSHSAQNAFLKLLEEPRPGVTFVLTAHLADTLLPTIKSRAQQITLQPLPQNILQDWLGQQPTKFNKAEVTQMLFIAQGRIGVLADLVKNPKSLAEYRALMEQAKILLSVPVFERLVMINNLVRDREKLVELLQAMAIIVKVQLASRVDERWLKAAEALEICLTALQHNGNPRAQLMRLFVSY